ncbi:peptidase M61 [Luteitalea sp. TBR-22]|uniref:M61 family metallopeptidase n=1 Tax=Luteitalea sp. TBR-22 TaxID=2802971 RepID=UPI001AF343AA|nr:PDZ domain-containing protein [Luteitalea sp. TBR-22]BCS35331.1 peptidase M61 [Luteitalea sp. TBR-22]
MPRPFLALVLFLSCLSPMTTDAQPAGARPVRPDADAAISYTLRFPDAARHYVDVEATYPTAGQARIELMMPVWTPGSYLVREYARHVEAVEVTEPAGAKAPVKVRKNRWAIETGGAARVTVRYRVYGREMSVRTNWVESRYALLNGAATYLTLVGGLQRPHHVSLVLPQGWTRAMSGLPEAGGRFTAADFDTLVDSPIVAGDLKVYEFTQSGKPHYLVNVNEGGNWDGARAVGDVQKIVAEQEKLWGSLPYDKYVFINMITEAGGGLEHKNSTVLMTSRWAMGTRQSYLGWLGLVSHEFFHVWNVKRMRPAALGPFDYETENYSPSLWVSEGFTSYYGDLLVRRAGLSTDAEYANGLSNQIRALESTAGRLVQPVTQSSYDAWIKQYRPDENSGNTGISYYTKGAVIAALLDARIRFGTNSQKSLDDVMRLAYQRYSGAKGFTEAEFRAVVVEVGGESLRDVLVRALDTTQPLDYQPLLDAYGLQFAPSDSRATRGWLGIRTRVDAGRLVISEVQRGTPAAQAGLNVDDEIIAIGDYRVRAEQWDARLDQYPPTTKASILVARRDELVRLDVTFGQEPGNAWRLQARPNASTAQIATRTAWLTGR